MQREIIILLRKSFGFLYSKNIFKMILEQRISSESLKSITLLSHRWNLPLSSDNNLETRLGLITLLGWIGYTILDHCLDGQHDAEQYIPLAERAMRELHWQLAEICQTRTERTIVTELLSLIETAHQAEIKGKVPPLWHKSAGHMIGPLILTLRQGHSPKSRVFIAAKNYFIEFLTIKQLSDDLRDWQEDWKAKRKTVVTEHLRRLVSTKDAKIRSSDLHRAYTFNVLPFFCKKLIRHGDVALRKFKETSDHRQPEHFIQMIERLQGGARNALTIIAEEQNKPSRVARH